MFRIRCILLVCVLAFSGCVSATHVEPTDEFSATTGIVTRPNQKPFIVDLVTNVIPLNSDGTMPQMAVDVRRSKPAAFLLSYKVYRRVQSTGAYALTETSPLWRIHARESSAEAFIFPDFVDRIFVGEYRFAIFINQMPWRVVEFKVVAHGT
jgi:hypothetical protein